MKYIEAVNHFEARFRKTIKMYGRKSARVAAEKMIKNMKKLGDDDESFQAFKVAYENVFLQQKDND